MNNFENFGLPESIIAALNKINFTTPTPIQEQAIPVAMNGCDILGSAQTGTGKTGAFTIPMIAHLMEILRQRRLFCSLPANWLSKSEKPQTKCWAAAAVSLRLCLSAENQ